MSDLNCKKPKPCDPKSPPPPAPCSEPFHLCVGDRTLIWDGFCLTTERPRTTPDGTYTSVTVKDGCIVGYGYAAEPTYTPPYCNPNPAHCQGGTTAAPAVNVASLADNTIILTAAGLYARTYVQAGNGVTISGTGTVIDPYIVSAAPSASSGSVSVVGRNGIATDNSVSGTTFVELEETGVTAGTYDISDQFTVDKYGRITSAESRSDPIVSAGAGLTAANVADGVQISHPIQTIDNTMVLGAYNVGISDTGHVIHTERAITVAAGVYQLGAYNVGLTEYGSVYSIEQRDDVMPAAGAFRTLDGKIINYDVSGRLTGITDTAASTTPADNLPLPLRDCYRVVMTASSVEYEVFGSPLNATAIGGAVHITLPDYVVSQTQINIGGQVSWRVDTATNTLIVNAVVGTPFTIALRG